MGHGVISGARLLACGLALSGLASCSSFIGSRDFIADLQRHPDAGLVVKGVPQLRADRGAYGAQALATALAYWQHPVSPQAVKEMAQEAPEGEFEERLMAVAESQGLWAYAWYGSLDALRARLASGMPVIVELQMIPDSPGSRRYAVVIGYDNAEHRILCEEGGPEPTVYTYAQFAEQWQLVRFWTLVVCPPEVPKWELSAPELVTRARFYEDRGKPDRALRDYQEAMVVQPLNSRICVNAANLYRKLGDAEKAEGLYRRAMDINPREGQAFNNLAFLFAEQKRNLDEAYELAKDALLIEPTNPISLDTIGYVLYLQGRYDDAISYLEQAYGRARMMPPDRRIEVAMHLARAYVGAGRTDRAGALLSDLRHDYPTLVIPEDLKAWSPSGRN